MAVRNSSSSTIPDMGLAVTRSHSPTRRGAGRVRGSRRSDMTGKARRREISLTNAATWKACTPVELVIPTHRTRPQSAAWRSGLGLPRVVVVDLRRGNCSPRLAAFSAGVKSGAGCAGTAGRVGSVLTVPARDLQSRRRERRSPSRYASQG
jgi:hypothetical protein